MAGNPSPPMFLQFFDPNNTGGPAAGYKLFTYIAGTTTKQATYTDATLETPNANPIILDSNGICVIWLNPASSYKYVLAPPNSPDPPTTTLRILDNISSGSVISIPGSYNPTFQSGNILYVGPGDAMAASDNFIAGLAIPNPSGSEAPAILLGSGGGSGSNVQAWLVTDQAFDNVTPGNTLGITAGETQAAGTANGGLLSLYGGGSFGGTGGLVTIQGGTSRSGPGGTTTVAGGNSTQTPSPTGPAGDLFLLGGQVGNAGANVHLIMTNLGGTSGDVRIRVNSTILLQFLQHGEIYLTSSGTGAGISGQVLTSQGVGSPATWQGGGTTSSPGYSILPGGLIFQWGGATTPTTGNVTDIAITFPLAFPNACFGVFPCTARNVATDGQALNGSNFASNITKTGATISIDISSLAQGSTWFAVGR